MERYLHSRKGFFYSRGLTPGPHASCILSHGGALSDFSSAQLSSAHSGLFHLQISGPGLYQKANWASHGTQASKRCSDVPSALVPALASFRDELGPASQIKMFPHQVALGLSVIAGAGTCLGHKVTKSQPHLCPTHRMGSTQTQRASGQLVQKPLR